MSVKEGRIFCGEHSNERSESRDHDDLDGDIKRRRIPCPLDPKHTCYEDKLTKHLNKCRSKPQKLPDYVNEGANSIQPLTVSSELLTLARVTDEELMSVIRRVEKLFQDRIESELESEMSKHPTVESEMTDPSFGKSALKHKTQNSSLLGLLQARGILERNLDFVEFGAGRGQLSHWLFRASTVNKTETENTLKGNRVERIHTMF